MVRYSLRITTCAIAAAIVFSGMNLTAQAAGVSSVLPNSGVNIALAKGTTLENLQAQVGGNTAVIQPVIDRKTLEESLVAANAIPQQSSEEDTFKNLVIAQVNDYVNVRSIPSEEGEIVGKLYNNSVGTFLGEQNGWYQITSGTTTGYVKAEYCVTGEAAVEIARKVGTRIATVTADMLRVREEASLESKAMSTVGQNDTLVVVEETPEWIKIDTEEGYGWVSAQYVTLSTEFVQAESREEEAQRLAKEEEERKKAREAAAAKAAEKAAEKAKKNQESQQAGQKAPSEPVAVGSGSEMGVAVAEYAVQFEGNPYVYGGTSLTKGADCSGFVMSVYANFGVSLPHSSSADRKQGAAVDGLANAQPGDLVCYSGHVALYIGNGKIVHASTEKTGIIISNADYKKVLAVRRIF